MKKLLALILALMLCISATVVFASCNKTDDNNTKDDATNATEPEPTEPPSPVNKEVATKAFNKIDLATFLSTTDSSLEEIRKLSAKAELNVNIPEESGTVTAAIKDGVFYLSAKGDESEKEEIFGKIGEDKIVAFELIEGVWETVNEIPLNPEDMFAETGVAPEDFISKIKIPELKAEYLTEKGDMLLVSNDYIYELIANNIAILYSEEIPETDLAEVKTEIKEFLKTAGIEVFVATGHEEITKFAISVKPTEDEGEFKSLYAEIALTDDAKNLKSVKAEWTAFIGNPEMNEVKTSKIELNTVIAENALVGVKANAEIYDYSYNYNMENSVGPGFEDILGDTLESIIKDTVLITKTTVAFDLDMSKLAEESGKVLTLDVDHTVEAAYEITSTLDPETFEWTDEVAKLDSVDAYKDSNVTIDASLTMNGANRADFSLKSVASGEEVTMTGYLATGDIEFPAIPDALKSKLN
ncbi:MAG: hypothetical protein II292_03715 [Clostridia bacterium]|nr:hypothetical protein [Clostridia bacterium]